MSASVYMTMYEIVCLRVRFTESIHTYTLVSPAGAFIISILHPLDRDRRPRHATPTARVTRTREGHTSWRGDEGVYISRN